MELINNIALVLGWIVYVLVALVILALFITLLISTFCKIMIIYSQAHKKESEVIYWIGVETYWKIF